MASLWKAPHKNFATTTLDGSINSSVTTITLASTVDLQAPGYIVINRQDASGNDTPSAREVVSYTGISGEDLTGCTRGEDGSTARAHTSGALVEANFCAGMWNDRIKQGFVTNAKARAYLSADQDDITDNTVTLVNLDTESYDQGSDFDTTNYYFVAPVDGYYLVCWKADFESTDLVADKGYQAYVYVGSTLTCAAAAQASVGASRVLSAGGADIIALSANDQVTLRVRHFAGVNTIDLESGSSNTFLAVSLISMD